MEKKINSTQDEETKNTEMNIIIKMKNKIIKKKINSINNDNQQKKIIRKISR